MISNGNPLGPQPDLNVIASEVLKVSNIPAIAGGQQILAELREMREQSTRDITAVREDIAAIRCDIAATRQDLITMMTASNHNNTARVQNTYVASRAEPLSPFLNHSDGTVIPEFPATSTALGQMTARQMDTVLQQLGLPPAPSANLAAKKKMLRAHIGLREVAAEPAP